MKRQRRITYRHPEFTGAANGITFEEPDDGPWILLASHAIPDPPRKGKPATLPMMIFIWEHE